MSESSGPPMLPSVPSISTLPSAGSGSGNHHAPRHHPRHGGKSPTPKHIPTPPSARRMSVVTTSDSGSSSSPRSGPRKNSNNLQRKRMGSHGLAPSPMTTGMQSPGLNLVPSIDSIVKQRVPVSHPTQHQSGAKGHVAGVHQTQTGAYGDGTLRSSTNRTRTTVTSQVDDDGMFILDADSSDESDSDEEEREVDTTWAEEEAADVLSDDANLSTVKTFALYFGPILPENHADREAVEHQEYLFQSFDLIILEPSQLHGLTVDQLRYTDSTILGRFSLFDALQRFFDAGNELPLEHAPFNTGNNAAIATRFARFCYALAGTSVLDKGFHGVFLSGVVSTIKHIRGSSGDKKGGGASGQAGDGAGLGLDDDDDDDDDAADDNGVELDEDERHKRAMKRLQRKQMQRERELRKLKKKENAVVKLDVKSQSLQAKIASDFVRAVVRRFGALCWNGGLNDGTGVPQHAITIPHEHQSTKKRTQASNNATSGVQVIAGDADSDDDEDGDDVDNVDVNTRDPCKLIMEFVGKENVDLRAYTNGVLFSNLTMDFEGQPKLLFKEFEFFQNIINACNYEMQMRDDFIVLDVEYVREYELVRGELVARFQRFCQDRNLVGWVCTDTPAHTDIAQVEVNEQAVGPLAVLDDDIVSDFMTLARSTTATSPYFSNPGIVSTLRGYFNPSKSMWQALPRTMGDRPQLVLLKQLIDDTMDIFSVEVESLQSRGKMDMGGNNSVVVQSLWLDVVSGVFSRVNDDEGQPHLICQAISNLMSHLAKLAAERPAYIDYDAQDDDRILVIEGEESFPEAGLFDDGDMALAGSSSSSSSGASTGASDTGAGVGESAHFRVIDDDPENDDDLNSPLMSTTSSSDEGGDGNGSASGMARDLMVFDVGAQFMNVLRSGRRQNTERSYNVGDGKPQGQFELGYRYRPAFFHHVVEVQAALRRNKLLRELSAEEEREMYTGDTRVNSMVKESHPDYVQAMEDIGKIVEDQQVWNADILKAFGKSALRALKALHKSLTHDTTSTDYHKIRVWQSEAAGLKYVTSNNVEKRYNSVCHVEDGTLHIYVRKGIPNLAEALIYCWMEHTGYSPMQCMILEGLARRERMIHYDTDMVADSKNAQDTSGAAQRIRFNAGTMSRSRVLSDRLFEQLQEASYIETCGFLQRTRKEAKKLLRARDISVQQRALGLQLHTEIQMECHYRLVEAYQSEHGMFMLQLDESGGLAAVDKHWETYDLVAKEFQAIVRQSSFREEQRLIMQTILYACNVGLRHMQARANHILFLERHLVLPARKSALNQLEMNVRDQNPYIIREQDLCTVYLEMGGSTDQDIQRQFDITKHSLGGYMYNRIRNKMVEENPSEENFAIEEINSYEKPVSVILGDREFVKKFLDGLFFMFPMLINLILVLVLEAGIYTSSRMSSLHRFFAGLGILVAFVAVGGLNSIIARIGSFYVFQWSYSVMLVLMNRIVFAGFSFCFSVALLVSLPLIPIFGWETIIFFGYTALFALLQLCIAALYNSHRGSIWVSIEGQVIIASMVAATALVLSLIFLVGMDPVSVHLIALAFTVLVLFFTFLYVVHYHSVQYADIKTTSDQEVNDWYAALHDVRMPPTHKDPAELDRLLSEWYADDILRVPDEERPDLLQSAIFLNRAKKYAVKMTRQARNEFVRAVHEARYIKAKDFVRRDALVQARAAKYYTEESLVHWYTLLTGKVRPDPASAEWDQLLDEGMGAMNVKQKTDLPHRGGLLWDMVRTYWVHGACYFALMFVDRLLRLAGGLSSSEFFVPTSPYELGVGWAQVYLLLAIGALEPILFRRAASVNNMFKPRMSETFTADVLIKSRSRQAKRIFWTEFKLMWKFVILALFASVGMMFFLSDSVTLDVLWVFGVSVLGYTGFIVGGFNSLFLAQDHGKASRGMMKGLLVGSLIGGGAMAAGFLLQIDASALTGLDLPKTTYRDFAVFGLLAGGIAYGAFTWPTPAKNKASREFDFASQAPMLSTGMATSGQRWLQGLSHGVQINEDHMTLLARQLYKRKDIRKVQGGETGKLVMRTLGQARGIMENMDETSLLRQAFPDAAKHLDILLRSWKADQIRVYLVPEQFLTLPSGQHFSALSYAPELDTLDENAHVDNLELAGSVEEKKGSRRVRLGYDSDESDDEDYSQPVRSRQTRLKSTFRRNTVSNSRRASATTDVKLVVFVGVQEERPPEEFADQIVEAMVHEYYEMIMGYPHSFAVAAELLVKIDPTGSVVPERILRELHATSDNGLHAVDQSADMEVMVKSLLGFDINEIDARWERIPKAQKRVIVSLLELVDPHFQAPPVTHMQLMAHTGLDTRRFNRAFRALIPHDDLWRRVSAKQRPHSVFLAMGQLNARLALAVKKAAREILTARNVRHNAVHMEIPFKSLVKAEYNPLQSKRNDESQFSEFEDAMPFGEKVLMVLDTFCRLSALALSADVTFGYEKDYAMRASVGNGGLPQPFKFLLNTLVTWTFNVNRVFVNMMVWLPLRLFRPDVQLLFSQVKTGLNRINFKARGRNGLDRVHRMNPEAPLTTFVEYSQETGLVERTTTYSGLLKTRPSDEFKGRVAYCVYKGGRIHQRFECKDKKVRTSAWYYYDGSHLQSGKKSRRVAANVPTMKEVYEKHVATEEEKQLRQPVEEFYYDDRGRVAQGLVMREVDLATLDIGGLDDMVFSIQAYQADGEEGGDETQGAGGSEGKVKLNVEVDFEYPVDAHVADSSANRAMYRCVLPHGDSGQGVGEGAGELELVVQWHDYSRYVDKTEVKVDRMPRVYTDFDYVHLHHPQLRSYIIDEEVGEQRNEDPTLVTEDPLMIVRKPPPSSFYDEDLVAVVPNQAWSFSLIDAITFRGQGASTVYTKRYPTRKARMTVWDAWAAGNLDGVYAQLLDEEILRAEPKLKKYWKYRDHGDLRRAKRAILKQEGSLTPVISFRTNSHLAFRVPDLLMCGAGGTAHSQGRSEKTNLTTAFDQTVGLNFSEENPLLTWALDSGTWPADGGGVASCRRDVINRLPRLRWICNAEIGNTMKIVQNSYQVEQNVASLTFVPLWGSEIGGPNQSILSNVPYGKLSARIWRTTDEIIVKFFLPLMEELVIGSVNQNPRSEQIDGYMSLFTNFYLFFQRYDWATVWGNSIVHQAWRRLWLRIETERYTAFQRELAKRRGSVSGKPIQTVSGENESDVPHMRMFAGELASLDDIDFVMNLYVHFLLPFTVPLPDTNVTHATHHGIQAVLGVVAKQIRQSSFLIWDHGVLWRERLAALDNVSYSLFVRNALVDLTRMCVIVNLRAADMVISCAKTNNPQWEQRMGGRGLNQLTTDVKRRQSPVINGMETNRFSPNRDLELDTPTSVMLSHVYDLKDVKNAIKAANVIVNQFGVKSYQLIVYGSLNKDLGYVQDCRDMIADNGLSNNVKLAGFGNASQVLPQGWLFLNSSKSEGLPLALGEAGLAGLPVVATDVGGSREVVRDQERDITFGAIAPAQNPLALAKAQVKVFCMLEELEALCVAPGAPKPDKVWTLDDFQPFNPDPKAPRLEQRMLAMKEHRLRLGMQYRAYILGSFTIERYLREHEQLISLGALRAREREEQLADKKKQTGGGIVGKLKSLTSLGSSPSQASYQ